MTNRSKPADYQPPYPAYSGHQSADRPEVVLALFGVQLHYRGADGDDIESTINQLLVEGREGRPLHFDKSTFIDAQGSENIVFIPYWATKEDQVAFWERSDVSTFIQTPVDGQAGWWLESFHAPTTSLDANYAISDIKYGIGRHSDLEVEQYHAYMGSMRDRVPDYLQGKADAEPGQLQRLTPPRRSRGATLRVSALPDKLCFIRSGFAWKDALPEEQEAYMRDMLPVYQEGANYLRDNPLESNCISMRMTDELNEGFDTGVQSNAIGWFLSLKDLERWVRSHPRHLAIMKTIMEYMANFDFKPKLNLGHEVIVVPKENLTCIYANCHEQTGFLPYFR
ncbi:TPA: phenylacetaldoxime dehydratase family protein [Pseudomonas aeruginosa]|uniref:phenylacetaldoxime dehydratase family protein n=1 Tax=Pseudomonas aeruginosa group TaxID=136841 RepID=UPI0018DF7D89|nr:MULTISPECIES: phenylacetaldoxime dehydratase family protein [Pseudomonas aeruginosa group]MBH9461535.1 phenylacetaldoxime dehydratase family protein [Pseudomonas aeruginosa]MBH9465995.1 phenylacetaldoxime dehydratase family protein [Pseudomonas aeruginosa]QPZ62063.1 phenylacetaldoxime dehydratase family protein [Pseudomonas aeruginosa]HCF0993065.1 phenylacetaldoxime dehydratase family protein [Pseudomonas aeruginosa]HCF9525611.1 phenylacetaldoxime dehydratase family protein [Pseudomonas aer